MKARIKKTGEIIEVLCISKEYVAAQCVDSTGTLRIRGFEDNEIEIIKETESATIFIDWEQRRYELVKEAMGAILSAPEYRNKALYPSGELKTPRWEEFDDIANRSIMYADTLISKLKEKEDDERSSIVEQAPNLYKALKEIEKRLQMADMTEWGISLVKIGVIAREAIMKCKKGDKK